jgi:hypothetical protein
MGHPCARLYAPTTGYAGWCTAPTYWTLHRETIRPTAGVCLLSLNDLMLSGCFRGHPLSTIDRSCMGQDCRKHGSGLQKVAFSADERGW